MNREIPCHTITLCGRLYFILRLTAIVKLPLRAGREKSRKGVDITQTKVQCVESRTGITRILMWCGVVGLWPQLWNGDVGHTCVLINSKHWKQKIKNKALSSWNLGSNNLQIVLKCYIGHLLLPSESVFSSLSWGFFFWLSHSLQ